MELARAYATFLADADAARVGFISAYAAPLGLACAPSHELAREGAVIMLQDAWSRFCRETVLVCAAGHVRTTGGSVIPRKFSSRTAALSALRATFTGQSKKAKDWEPKWFDATQAIDAAQRLAIPNFATVSAAIGSSPSPLGELRAVRNFFAHRGATAGVTARTVVGVASTFEVHDYLTAPQLGGALRFELWIDLLRAMARAGVR